MPAESGIVVQLSNIQEFFVAPPVNPFSTRRVDILGETGLEIAQKRVLQHWPFLPRTVHITVQLPPDQISRDLAQATRADVVLTTYGLLARDVAGVLTAYAAQGFALVARSDLDGWATLVLRSGGAAARPLQDVE